MLQYCGIELASTDLPCAAPRSPSENSDGPRSSLGFVGNGVAQERPPLAVPQWVLPFTRLAGTIYLLAVRVIGQRAKKEQVQGKKKTKKKNKETEGKGNEITERQMIANGRRRTFLTPPPLH